MQDGRESKLIGAAPSFLESLRRIRRLAEYDVTVLIQGETGTGKELAARAIHYHGERRNQPFIPVNCGAIPDSLVENEFFGHVRGAFTDARDSHAGLVATAEGGTLFLDEIECLSPRGQVVLLRFLQDRKYRPLGARQHREGNVRVVAAGNASLAEMVRAGTFREDLLYRLTVLTLELPPLRERGLDVLLLADHFIRRFRGEYGLPELALSIDAMHSLLAHDWPGNIRELENLIHRACIMADDGRVHIETPPPGPADASTPPARVPLHLGFRRAKALVVAEFERTFLRQALQETGGNVSAAARLSGKERRAFGKLLRKHGITPQPQ
jgi:two-component system, NtrC family, response regulator GlrR